MWGNVDSGERGMNTALVTTRPLRARLSLDGKRIVLTGYSPDLLEFFYGLPEARFDRVSSSWSCLLTPVSAWRVVARMEDIPEGRLAAMAMAFRAGRMLAEHVRGPDAMDGIKELPTRTRAWQHQKVAFAFVDALGSALLAQGMGTGKSLVAIGLANKWKCKTVLIVCPKSVMRVWPREFGRHSAVEFPIKVLDRGSVAQRTKMAATLHQAAGRQESRLILVINYDGVWRGPFGNWALMQQWDLVILDESHRAKSHSSSVSKYLAKLARKATHRLCLTGTPMGQSPLDLFGQFRFLDPGVFGTSWTTFSNRYAKHQNPTIPQQITGYQNQEELQERMSWLTYRCRVEDVLDLPEKHHVDRRFELGKEGRRIYRELEEELIAEVADGVVTAANVMVKLLRLAQCTSGFLTPDDSEQVEEFDTAKLDALQEILEDIDPTESVVVFTRFRHDCKRIRGLAEKLGRRYGELSGSRRDALDDQAELTTGIQVAAINLQSGGLGVDLTRACYCVFYGVNFSLIEYDQALARVHRPGQRRRVTYLHLVGTGTVEEYIYAALNKRREIVDEVLSILNPRTKDEEHADRD